MSGVAKDETTLTSSTDETVIAPGETVAVPVETPVAATPPDTPAEQEARAAAARRSAPHLRVVTAEDADAAGTDHLAGVPVQRIGAIIRAARENQGLTLEQVSKETRIHLSHLRAIEDMTPGLLGAPVYAKGYIRNYARHLKLDADDTLERYLGECAILKDPEKQEIAPPVTSRKLPVAVPVLGLLIVALIGAAALFFVFNGDTKIAASDVAATEAGSSAAVAVAAAPPLHIVALRRERIEVRSAAGDKFLARYMEPGEVYPPRVGAGWTVSTEDGSAFEWRLGDVSLGLVAAGGGPVYAQSIDAAAKRAPVDLPPAPPQAKADPVVTSSAPAVTSASPRSATTIPAPTPSVAGTPAGGGQRPAASQPRPQVAKPPVNAPVVTAPVAAAPPPAPVPTSPASPASDPALAAYPDN